MKDKSIKAMLARPIAVSPVFIQLTGSHSGAIFLSQAIYWEETMGKEYYKTNESWQDELYMTKRTLESARKKCSKYVTVTKKGIPARNFYKIEWEKLKEDLANTEPPERNKTVPTVGHKTVPTVGHKTVPTVGHKTVPTNTETTTKITKKTTTKFFSNEKSESVDSVKGKKANSVNDRLDENKELSEKEEITPPKNSAKSPPTALALAYKFCTEFKLPIMNNTVFKSKMKALSKLMDDDSEKIDMYFATLAKLQDQECIDDPFCPKVYNALDIYSKYNNIRTYYASKMKEAAAKMSTVEELMNKQAGRQWEI